MRRKMLILSYGKYPNGNAGAVRQHAFAKLFSEIGYDVTVIGMGESTDFKIREYEGIKYISFRKSPNTIINRVLNWFFYGCRLKSFLKEHNDYTDILFVKAYFEWIISFIKRYANKNNIKLYHDSVEWYSPEEFKHKERSIAYIKNNRMNTKLIDKQFHVIAISSYLERHFKSKGIDTIRIPVIMDSNSIDFVKERSDRVTITYAGRIGKKDYISNILNAFFLLDKDYKDRVEFRLIGASVEQVSKITEIPVETLNENDDYIHCLGRVSRDEVLRNLKESDYTILIRDANLRYAKAGFPTKIVESLMSGTPVICNLSSDLGDYLTDGKDAVISDGISPEVICYAIQRAIKVPLDEMELMKQNARYTAEKHFDYHKYIDSVQQWSLKDE